MLLIHNFKCNPTGVGRPEVIEAAGPLSMRCLGRKLLHGFTLEVHDTEIGAVENKAELLAVGRDFGHGALMAVGLEHRFLAHHSGMGEVGLVGRFGECSPVNVVQSVAVGSVVKRGIIAPHYLRFSARSVGYLLGCGIIDRCHIDIAAIGKSHLFAVGRHFCATCATGSRKCCFLIGIIRSNRHFYLGRFCAGCGSEGVNLAVVGECERAVVSAAEKTHRVLLERCNRLGVGRIRRRSFINIK